MAGTKIDGESIVALRFAWSQVLLGSDPNRVDPKLFLRFFGQEILNQLKQRKPPKS